MWVENFWITFRALYCFFLTIWTRFKWKQTDAHTGEINKHAYAGHRKKRAYTIRGHSHVTRRKSDSRSFRQNNKVLSVSFFIVSSAQLTETRTHVCCIACIIVFLAESYNLSFANKPARPMMACGPSKRLVRVVDTWIGFYWCFCQFTGTSRSHQRFSARQNPTLATNQNIIMCTVKLYTTSRML